MKHIFLIKIRFTLSKPSKTAQDVLEEARTFFAEHSNFFESKMENGAWVVVRSRH